MENIIVLFLLVTSAVGAVPDGIQRIVGGSQTTISAYPSMASLMFGATANLFRHSCGGAILNNRAILTAAHCSFGDAAARWRVRVESGSSISGGTIHNLQRITIHPNYNSRTLDNDIAIMRTATAITLGGLARAARTAGASYNLADNQAVWAVGWGSTSGTSGASVSQLRHVQILAVNQALCRTNYAAVGRTITANMLCAGNINAGGRGQCRGDDGGPLFHNGVVVGVYSFSNGCGIARFPGVNTRVSRYAAWISANS